MLESAPPEPLVCCAYDGSVNAHWVARYAIHLASATPSRTLRLVHVRDRHISRELLERKIEHVLAECRRAGVDAGVHDLHVNGDVAEAVLEAVPASRDTFLLCGTRARARRRKLLSGTVSEGLLRRAQCNVLVLRVVVPGLLGSPHKLLLPLAGKPGEARAVSAILQLLAPGLEELHVLQVVVTSAATAHTARRPTLARLRARGHASVTRMEDELRSALPLGRAHVDAYVRIASDWTRPAVITASQHDCDLMLAGASQRLLGGTLPYRWALERLLADTPCDVGIFRAAP